QRTRSPASTCGGSSATGRNSPVPQTYLSYLTPFTTIYPSSVGFIAAGAAPYPPDNGGFVRHGIGSHVAKLLRLQMLAPGSASQCSTILPFSTRNISNCSKTSCFWPAGVPL